MTQYIRAWQNERDFSTCTGKGVRFKGNEIRLRRGVTLADELGRCNDRDREIVTGLRQVKKSFVINTIDTSQVQLCPYLHCEQEDGALDILINGNVVQLQWKKERPYWTDRWTPVAVPVSYFKTGTNDFVFRAVGNARWTLLIENSRHPDRSAVSEDGGQTWRSEALGVNNRADGEYMVRLWLDQHFDSGEIISGAFDALLSGDGVAPDGRVALLRFEVDAEMPDGTQVRLMWRGGSTPAYDPKTWTAWREVAGDVTPGEGVRFVQWRAVLETARPSQTPVLKGVTVHSGVDVVRAVSAIVMEADNSDVVRGSHRFSYLQADEKRGKRLRERWKLDEVIRGARTEFDAFLHLRQWVREQWEDGWNMGEIDFCPPWDAMVILELAGQKLSLGMCTHYATVMAQASASLGLVARTQIMRSHCINEVWSSEHKKWVAMDVGGDMDDETKFTYHFERDGVPLSALEAHKAWVEGDYKDVVVVPQPPAATKDRFLVEKRLRLFERFMISMRNDELSTMDPGEPEHGYGSYHYDGYLFWEDEKTEPLPWFSQHTDREEDLYWTVNRAKIHLQQGEAPDRLQVLLETETPNLKGFEIRVDEGAWEARTSAFAWCLHKGKNRLAVRPVNAFDRTGTESWIHVDL